MSSFLGFRASYAMQAEHESHRDEGIMSVGKQCSARACQLVDFLPIKCDHCKEPFCSDHFKPESHDCSKWDRSQADRRALECFVCTKLIAIPPGADPNLRMDEHLERECPGKPGVATKASSTPVCGAARCNKKLVAQAIECKDCKKKFCASHYHPASHKCASASTASSSGSQSMLSKMGSAKSAAALAALERVKNAKPIGSTSVKSSLFSKSKSSAASSTPGASSSSSSTDSPKPSKPGNNPFSARDRHAKEERASQLKAMKAKIDKGLITDSEEIKRFEQMKAEYEDKNDCILM